MVANYEATYYWSHIVKMFTLYYNRYCFALRVHVMKNVREAEYSYSSDYIIYKWIKFGNLNNLSSLGI
jgi:hypothetical protein